MGDLISRSALIKMLETYKFGCLTNEVERDYIKETMIEFVKTEPTAYNVEKVVAELEQSRMIFFLTIANTRNDELDFAYKNVCTALDKAIDIVKRGGVDERA